MRKIRRTINARNELMPVIKIGAKTKPLKTKNKSTPLQPNQCHNPSEKLCRPKTNKIAKARNRSNEILCCRKSILSAPRSFWVAFAALITPKIMIYLPGPPMPGMPWPGVPAGGIPPGNIIFMSLPSGPLPLNLRNL